MSGVIGHSRAHEGVGAATSTMIARQVARGARKAVAEVRARARGSAPPTPRRPSARKPNCSFLRDANAPTDRAIPRPSTPDRRPADTTRVGVRGERILRRSPTTARGRGRRRRRLRNRPRRRLRRPPPPRRLPRAHLPGRRPRPPRRPAARLLPPARRHLPPIPRKTAARRTARPRPSPPARPCPPRGAGASRHRSWRFFSPRAPASARTRTTPGGSATTLRRPPSWASRRERGCETFCKKKKRPPEETARSRRRRAERRACCSRRTTPTPTPTPRRGTPPSRTTSPRREKEKKKKKTSRERIARFSGPPRTPSWPPRTPPRKPPGARTRRTEPPKGGARARRRRRRARTSRNWRGPRSRRAGKLWRRSPRPPRRTRRFPGSCARVRSKPRKRWRSSRPPRSSRRRSKARRRYVSLSFFVSLLASFSFFREEEALLHSAARLFRAESVFSRSQKDVRAAALVAQFIAPSRNAGRVMESGSPPASPKTPDEMRRRAVFGYFFGSKAFLSTFFSSRALALARKRNSRPAGTDAHSTQTRSDDDRTSSTSPRRSAR